MSKELIFMMFAKKLMHSSRKNSLKHSVIKNLRNSNEVLHSHVAYQSTKFVDISHHLKKIHMHLSSKTWLRLTLVHILMVSQPLVHIHLLLVESLKESRPMLLWQRGMRSRRQQER